MISPEILNFIMIATGITSALVPLYFASRFWKDIRGLGLVLAIMLIGESIAMAVTTEFAIQGIQHNIQYITYMGFFIRRMFVFLPCLLSTMILGTFYCKRLNRLRQEQENMA